MSAENLMTAPLFRTSLRQWQATYKANQEPAGEPEAQADARTLRFDRTRRKPRKTRNERNQD